jgi:Fic/DOC family
MIRWNIAALPGAGAVLAGRAPALLQQVRGKEAAARLAVVADSRSLHAALFDGLAPADLPEAAGTWRGTPGTGLATAARAVFVTRTAPGLRRRDLCAPAAEVAARMEGFAAEAAAIWAGGDRVTEAEALASLARMLATFFAIHPYLDGNGHVGRMLAVLLADRLGLHTDPGWTLHQRPYGHVFSLCLQWYPAHPDLLADHLRRWFRR